MKNIILLILVIFLFGCADVEQEAPDSENSQVTQSPEQTEQEIIQQTMQTELKVVGRKYPSFYRTSGVSTQQGFYDHFKWKPEMYDGESESIFMHTTNLIYTDYATGVRTHLCSVPSCAHNSESCTSYLRYPTGLYLFTNSNETSLFVVALGSYADEVKSDEELGRIYKMDMDGSNRKEIYKLEANESFYTNTLDRIIAEENIYIGVTKVVDATSEPIKEFRKINIETGEAEVLFEYLASEMVVSAYNDIIVIIDSSNYVLPDNINRNSETLNGEVTGVVIYGHSLTSGTKVKLYDMTTYSGDVIGNNLFAVVRTSEELAKLIVVDLKTGERKIIENIPAKTTANISVSDYFEGKLIYHYQVSIGDPVDDGLIGDTKEILVTQERTILYMVDIETGETTEIALGFNEDTPYEEPVGIVAETNDSYLVIMGKNPDSSVMLNDREGISHTYPYNRPTYALIDKDDYYNSIPNYRIIEDLI